MNSSWLSMTFAAAGSMMADPSGRGLGFLAGMLEGTPFETYFVPGLLLFVVVGGTMLVAALGVIRSRSWGVAASLLAGGVLLIWLLVQYLLLGFYALQALTLGLGLLTIVLTLRLQHK
ncbi:MAG TPA: hypothetical protein VGR25_10015 [bacterium]|jgi:hypothetical protein|nr:hypothetical protein [bacterium]